MAGQSYIVGIAGGSASGKTSFLNDLRSRLPSDSVSIISQDNYYLPKELQVCDEAGEVNFDLPSAIHREDFHNDLCTLLSGAAVERKEYNFNNPNQAPKIVRIEPAPIIIMEGLFVFYYQEIRTKLDLKIFIDAREEVKLQRRIMRDSLERGYCEDAVRYQWQNHVVPSYNKFLRPFRDSADVIVTNNTHYNIGLNVLNNHLQTLLKEQVVVSP